MILVAVDGGQPGYSVGMTSFELRRRWRGWAPSPRRASSPGGDGHRAFDGQLLNRPSDPGGERPVSEALLVEYFGVYAPPVPVRL